jgi:LacI family transcriptional regulator
MIPENARTKIKDVAREAGVSITTVSRVLNNPDRVKRATRIKVQETIEKMNYRPDPIAQALVGQRGKYVAIMVPNLRNLAMISIIQGAMEELHVLGYEVLMYDFNSDARMEKQMIDMLLGKAIAGVIFFPSLATDEDLEKINNSIPLVVLERGTEDSEFDRVVVDEETGLRLLVKHLEGFGHKNIGMITGKAGTSIAERRKNCFRKVMSQQGFEINERWIIDTDWSMKGGADAFFELLSKDKDITGVICASDVIAQGVLGAAYQIGMNVPSDISVVGFDNIIEGELSVPPLTTLSYPTFQMGSIAARRLMEKISRRDSTPQSRVLPLSIVSRQSVAEPRKDE